MLLRGLVNSGEQGCGSSQRALLTGTQAGPSSDPLICFVGHQKDGFCLRMTSLIEQRPAEPLAGKREIRRIRIRQSLTNGNRGARGRLGLGRALGLDQAPCKCSASRYSGPIIS